MGIKPTRQDTGTLADVLDRILDKGLVINADILVSVAGVELLGLKVRAALASFATAARYGLEFPSGTNYQTVAWKEALIGRETCPQCDKLVETDELLNQGCPWCGWVSAKARRSAETAPGGSARVDSDTQELPLPPHPPSAASPTRRSR